MGKFTYKTKIERREGTHLHLKGNRCSSPKCALTRRNFVPGVHGPLQRRHTTPYGEQLREKQKVKRFYGLLEKQFRRYFDKASTLKGDTGVFFAHALESRFDNVVYRVGFASSRRQARQMVNHAHFLVNGQPNNIPSLHVCAGDVISVKKSKQSSKLYQSLPERISKITLPTWATVDVAKFEAKILTEPDTDDVLNQFDLKKIIEFYSR